MVILHTFYWRKMTFFVTDQFLHQKWSIQLLSVYSVTFYTVCCCCCTSPISKELMVRDELLITSHWPFLDLWLLFEKCRTSQFQECFCSSLLSNENSLAYCNLSALSAVRTVHTCPGSLPRCCHLLHFGTIIIYRLHNNLSSLTNNLRPVICVVL